MHHQGVPLCGGDLPGAAPGRLPGHEPRHELLHHVRPAARPRLRGVHLTHTHPHKQVWYLTTIALGAIHKGRPQREGGRGVAQKQT